MAKLAKTRQISEELGVPVGTLERLARADDLPRGIAVRLGGRGSPLLWNQERLTSFLDQGGLARNTGTEPPRAA